MGLKVRTLAFCTLTKFFEENLHLLLYRFLIHLRRVSMRITIHKRVIVRPMSHKREIVRMHHLNTSLTSFFEWNVRTPACLHKYGKFKNTFLDENIDLAFDGETFHGETCHGETFHGETYHGETYHGLRIKGRVIVRPMSHKREIVRMHHLNTSLSYIFEWNVRTTACLHINYGKHKNTFLDENFDLAFDGETFHGETCHGETYHGETYHGLRSKGRVIVRPMSHKRETVSMHHLNTSLSSLFEWNVRTPACLHINYGKHKNTFLDENFDLAFDGETFHGETFHGETYHGETYHGLRIKGRTHEQVMRRITSLHDYATHGTMEDFMCHDSLLFTAWHTTWLMRLTMHIHLRYVAIGINMGRYLDFPTWSTPSHVRISTIMEHIPSQHFYLHGTMNIIKTTYGDFSVKAQGITYAHGHSSSLDGASPYHKGDRGAFLQLYLHGERAPTNLKLGSTNLTIFYVVNVINVIKSSPL